MNASTYWLETATRFEPEPPPLPAAAEVVVIGGGIMGLSTACRLARLGAGVLLLEAATLGAGASGRNAGLALHGASRLENPQRFTDFLAREGIKADYVTNGHLALAGSDDVWQAMQDEIARRPADARPLRALDRDGCESLLGRRIAPRFRGGRWLPGGASLHPGRLVHGLASAARSHGARIAERTAVLGVEAHGRGLRVSTCRGEVRAKQVVYAAGATTTTLVPALAPLIHPVDSMVLCTEPVAPAFAPGMAVDWGTVFWRQTSDGRIVLGGRWTGEDGASRLEHFLTDAFPGFEPVRIERRWSGTMDGTPDGRPIAGRLPGTTSQWVLLGFGGHGIPSCTGFGTALAESIFTARVVPELEPFAVERWRT